MRAGGKAVLGGSVARLGDEYVLNLNAINCQTGEPLAQEQLRASAKEKVLSELDRAASSLRSKLGESLRSIKVSQRPLTDFISTSSLEAFQAYGNGQHIVQERGRLYAIPFYRRAADLDTDFAMAYVQLGILYAYLGEPRLSAENSRKAYELRDRVNEWERFFIDAQYYLNVTGQLEKAPPVCQVWARSDPIGSAPERAAEAYLDLGQPENALVQIDQAHRQRGDLGVTVNLLARIYFWLNRFQDAQTILEKAFAQNPDQLFWRQGMYLLAFFAGDARRMEDQVAWAMHTSGSEDQLLSMHASTKAYFGHVEEARELTGQAVYFAQRSELRERAALLVAREALWEAWLGNSAATTSQARAALIMFPGRDVRALVALALARTGDVGQVSKLADQLDAEFPLSTLIHGYWLPTIRAEIELHAGDYNKAAELLRTTEPYELADTPSPLIPIYTRAETLLRAGKGGAAAAEFQKLLNHRGIVGNSPLGALAHLGLARAYAASGETTKARNKYEDFFKLWKDADANVPVLQQAKAEYVKFN